MSLDVYLTMPGPAPKVIDERAIFIRENGQTKQITRDEWDRRYPDQEPATCSIYSTTERESVEVYSANITHNLGEMARHAGVYDCCWRPDEHGITKASQLIESLAYGLTKLRVAPDYYRQFDALNGWGTYDQFLPWLRSYLEACEEYPDATVEVSR